MPRATGQLTSEVSSLSELKRSELQALAKTYGIKANGKSQVIINSLLANKAFVDSRKEAKSRQSSASVQFSPNAIEAQPRQNSDRYRTPRPMPPQQQVVEDTPNNPDARAEGAQNMMEVRRSLVAMNEEQSLLQEVVDKLHILNEETGCILEERAAGLKKMIWTRQILEHLCVGYRASDGN